MAHCYICHKYSGPDAVHPGCAGQPCPHRHAKWMDGYLACSTCEDELTQPEGKLCIVCADTGIDDYAEAHCECAAGQREVAELEARFWGEVGPRFDQAMRAERDGDFETAKAITDSCGVRYSGRVA